jgi:hypothetical protein
VGESEKGLEGLVSDCEEVWPGQIVDEKEANAVAVEVPGRGWQTDLEEGIKAL